VTNQKSIVIAYEDNYCDEFHLLVKKLRRDLGQSDLILEARPVKGTGQFINEVPKLLRTPLKQTKSPPDRVVCVADADKPGNLVPLAEKAPPTADVAELDQWVSNFDASWLNHLKQECKLPEDSAARLHVVSLRWNKESLLISSLTALREYATVRECSKEVEQILAQCKPHPENVINEAFISHYRDPQACLDKLIRAVERRGYKKGRDDEDMLKQYVSSSEERRRQVLARCPDLYRLLALLQFPAFMDGSCDSIISS
jgi:hypothetical protein